MSGVHLLSRSGVLLAVVLMGCGLTVTNERPGYEDLDPEEKSAVDIILSELERLNAQVEQRTDYSIARVVDRDRIHVSFEGLIFSGNLGDDVIHVATWDNLSSTQQELVGEWFDQQPAAAKATYEMLFYRFMAVMQGVKQYMYEAYDPPWVYSHRTLYSVEKDAVRTTLAHYVAEGRKSQMWGLVTSACAPILADYAGTYASNFSKAYLQDHFHEIIQPEAPTGYMYYFCRWVNDSKAEVEGLTAELDWIIEALDGK